MFKRLLGIGPSIGEIQAGHYKQASQSMQDLKTAVRAGNTGQAQKVWGEFCTHVNEAGYRGQTWPEEFRKDVHNFVTQNWQEFEK